MRCAAPTAIDLLEMPETAIVHHFNIAAGKLHEFATTTGREMTAGPGRGDFGQILAHLCENQKGLEAPHQFLGRGFVTGAYSRQEIGKGGLARLTRGNTVFATGRLSKTRNSKPEH